jgi:hypothetical protein
VVRKPQLPDVAEQVTAVVDPIRSLLDVRPGDICLTTMRGFIPGVFPVRVGTALCRDSFRIGPFSADHALICVEAGFIDDRSDSTSWSPRAVQAMPRGAEEIALTPAKHWTDGVAWFRMPEDYPGQAADAAAIARLFVEHEVPYSFLSYVALAAWSRGLKAERLEAWIDRREPPPGHFVTGAISGIGVQLPREAICSVLVDQAWSLAGKRVIEGVKRQCVTPGRLAIELDRRLTAYGPAFLAST